jgi:aspartyl-tRNA(Asn)/glutamyl-tRNA(Gln) amidotransferase subunit A
LARASNKGGRLGALVQGMSSELSRRRFLATAGATVVAGSAVARSAAPSRAAGLPEPGRISSTDPADLGILECASLLQARKLSARELADACRRRIAARNGPVTFDGSATTINAWIRLYPDLAEQGAAAADARLARGHAPWLCGVPVGLKDLYAVAGRPVTASSHVLDGNIAPGDSTVWARLKAAGMVLLGHTHTAEFAFSTGTPQTGNPWDVTKTPGGSSGGSGAALAARMVPAATGSDTGGSLRLPSAVCNTSTIKPTYGLVPTDGIIPLAWSRDHAGPMARSVADCALMLSAMAGPAVGDPSSLAHPDPAPYPIAARAGAKPLRGTRIGVLNPPADSGLPATIQAIVDRTQAQLASLGATLVGVDAATDPTGNDERAALAIVAEAVEYHKQWFPAHIASYGGLVGQGLAAYTAIAQATTAQDYLRSLRLRVQYVHAWAQVFAEHRLDAILETGLSAECQSRAAAAGGLTIATTPGESGPVTQWDIVGFPVVGVPAGRSSQTGMPIGVQLIGLPDRDGPLLQVAIDYQERFPYHLEAPKP